MVLVRELERKQNRVQQLRPVVYVCNKVLQKLEEHFRKTCGAACGADSVKNKMTKPASTKKRVKV